MARSKSYERQILNAINRTDERLKGVKAAFDVGSEQYQRYVNSITASLPPGSYTLDEETGEIYIPRSKENLKSLKLEQLRKPSHLPTARQSIKAQKKEMQADAEPGEEISDEDALRELNAKTFVQNREDSKGKIKYSESMRADLSKKGKKSYSELRDIIEKGDAKDAGQEKEKTDLRRQRNREASKRYYERNRERILANRRAAARVSANV